jgi:isoleucyl-tRNA synthetase
MYHILQALTRWLVPILSFTAEEIWQHFPWHAGVGKTDSVLLSTWYDAWGDVQFSEAEKQFWAMLMQMRESVNMQLEEARNLGDIGSGLAAEVTITIDKDHSIANQAALGMLDAQFKAMGDELRFVFITSAVTIQFSPYDPHPNQMHFLWDGCSGYVNIQPSTHEKCERCWNRCNDIGQNATHPTLCARCIKNVDGQGEMRIYA